MDKKITSHFKKHDPKIFAVMEKVDYTNWLTADEKPSPQAYFRSLCRNIIGQQLSGKAANSIYKKFISVIGTKSYTPKQIAAASHEQLRSAGLSNAKAKHIRCLADAVIENSLQLSKIQELDDDEVISQLTQVKGIGEWTAQIFLMFTLQRPNLFAHKDLGLKKGMAKVYGLEMGQIDHAKMERITAKWSPYKTYGSIALWESLEQE